MAIWSFSQSERSRNF